MKAGQVLMKDCEVVSLAADCVSVGSDERLPVESCAGESLSLPAPGPCLSPGLDFTGFELISPPRMPEPFLHGPGDIGRNRLSEKCPKASFWRHALFAGTVSPKNIDPGPRAPGNPTFQLKEEAWALSPRKFRTSKSCQNRLFWIKKPGLETRFRHMSAVAFFPLGRAGSERRFRPSIPGPSTTLLKVSGQPFHFQAQGPVLGLGSRAEGLGSKGLGLIRAIPDVTLCCPGQ